MRSVERGDGPLANRGSLGKGARATDKSANFDKGLL